MLFLSFLVSLSPFAFSRPMYIFVGLVTHHSCHLGLTGFFCFLSCQFFVTLIIGLFRLLGFHKWPSTFSLLNIWNVPAIHMWMKRRFCPSLKSFFSSLFSRVFFKLWTPSYIYTYILLPAANRVVSSNFSIWQLFSKQSCHFINFIPFWWLTRHLLPCYY